MKLKPLIITVLVFFSQTAAFGQSGALPRLEPDPKALEYRRLTETGGYSWTELAEISLWASGDTTASNLDKIRVAAEVLSLSPELPSSDAERAEFILTYMHKNFLKSYSLTQTRIDTIFSNGRFNCVSSAVLYMILCKSAGIETSAVMTKDHAFITLHIGETDIDVETTNPYGFDPGTRKEFNDQFGKATGFAYVSPRNYRDRETISQIELISLILNNRIAEFESRSRYSDAVPLAVDRYTLLSGEALAVNRKYDSLFSDPRHDLMDRLFNHGASLLKSGKEEEGLRWAKAASSLYPDEERWQEFVLAAANNHVTKLTKAGKIADAIKFLEGQKSLLAQADYAHLESMLIDSDLLGRANKIRTIEEGRSIVDEIERAGRNSQIGEKRAGELLTFAVQKTAAAACAPPARNWRAAIECIEDALSRFGANGELEKALRTYRDNLAADYHNRFASAWNKKDFDEAERILKEGLAELPNDRLLLSDKETADKRR